MRMEQLDRRIGASSFHQHLRGDPVVTPNGSPAAPTLLITPRSTVEPVAFACLEALVEIRDLFGITVEELGGDALLLAERQFRLLAPARMIDGRIHIGPEAVFVGGY